MCRRQRKALLRDVLNPGGRGDEPPALALQAAPRRWAVTCSCAIEIAIAACCGQRRACRRGSGFHSKFRAVSQAIVGGRRPKKSTPTQSIQWAAAPIGFAER